MMGALEAMRRREENLELSQRVLSLPEDPSGPRRDVRNLLHAFRASALYIRSRDLYAEGDLLEALTISAKLARSLRIISAA